MNILQLIDPMVEATNPYNTMLGMSRAIDELPPTRQKITQVRK